ncbi:phosphatidylserine decarboxylase 1 [Dispira simplex]|nr:phosphatidylserine decarboxylase 1 [Dispira simplex]
MYSTRLLSAHHSRFPTFRPAWCRLPLHNVPKFYSPNRFLSTRPLVNGKNEGKGQQSQSKEGWYWIPTGVGLGFLGVFQFLRIQRRESEKRTHGTDVYPGSPAVPEGPWQVHIMTALPLKAMSRLFGAFNGLTIPLWLREPGFHLYSWLFGCQLDEMLEPDLRKYPNLGEFFYRALKPGVRPLDPNASLVSPSDGRVLNFGVIKGQVVESVKGLTYSLDAFLGNHNRLQDVTMARKTVDSGALKTTGSELAGVKEQRVQELAQVSRSSAITDDKEFAQVNGITYSLKDLLGTEHDLVDNANRQAPNRAQLLNMGHQPIPGHELFFCVIYLAPGDYHRFHSPTNWVVETRRHFAGELYSVSPYVLKMIQDLFVLNERVALLGRWKYGFMSMTPVGATNVGSVKINFDPILRTNVKENVPSGSFREVSYRMASPILQGVPLVTGEEMGGFRLGSTIVLVFEAPSDFKFLIQPEQRILMGQALGTVPDSEIL